MNKKELLNKLNEIIDKQYCSVVREIFEEMIDTNNINRDIDTYINIETGEIFTEVYRGIEPIEPNPYVIHLATHYGCDITFEIYENIAPFEEKEICKELGIYNEWLDNDENGCMSFYELLEATGKKEEFEGEAIENCYDNWDIGIRDLTEEDLVDLDTDHIEL